MNSRRTPRARHALRSLVVLACSALCVVMLVLITGRFSYRFDVTATGEHRLSPRSLSLLGSLSAPHAVVIAGSLGGIPTGVKQDVLDVLEQFRRASPQIETTVLDTGSPDGLTRYAQLLGTLAQRQAPQAQAQRQAVEQAMDQAAELARALNAELGAGLEQIAQGAGAYSQTLSDRAAAARVAGRDLLKAIEQARQELVTNIAGVELISADLSAATLSRQIAPLADQLNTIAAELRTLARQLPPGPAADRAPPLAGRTAALRDSASLLADSLKRVAPLDLQRVARALRTDGTALLIGPPGAGVVAIDLHALFPTADIGRADLRPRAEELLATALGSLTTAPKPIVVLMHGEAQPFLEPLVALLASRLRQHGIDTLEWAPLAQSEPTGLAELNPDARRPVVYVCVSPNTTQGGKPTGVQRAGTLGETLAKLVKEGHPLLLSLNPSVFPGYGDTDPIAAVLGGFGLRADSGRPLLNKDPASGVVQNDFTLVARAGEDPITKSVAGLPTFLTWPIAISRAGTPGTHDGTIVHELYRVEGGASAWAESQWIAYWQTPPAQRRLVPNPPAFDAERDENAGPWAVAVAAQRPSPVKPGEPQRLIAVGSNSWFIDQVTQPTRGTVDGRSVPLNPGNAELFESSVLWLAGQDWLIAQSPQARAVPLIRTLAPAQVFWLRVLVIAALPLGVLLLGLAWRAWRR